MVQQKQDSLLIFAHLWSLTSPNSSQVRRVSDVFKHMRDLCSYQIQIKKESFVDGLRPGSRYAAVSTFKNVPVVCCDLIQEFSVIVLCCTGQIESIYSFFLKEEKDLIHQLLKN